MNKICPITPFTIDENQARMNSFLVILLLLAFVFSNALIILYFLAIDFFVRGFIGSRYSITCIISKKLLELLRIAPKRINAGPKIFAAQVGFFFVFFILVAFLLNLSLLAYLVLAVLSLCALLEAVFSFCVACQLYPLVLVFSKKAA